MDKLNKLSLPATILIASLILGGFIFASQVIKQQSIERQQQIELEAKAEQDNRDYIAKRKLDCLAIYKTESDKFSNTINWNYKEPTKTGRYIPINSNTAIKKKTEPLYKRIQELVSQGKIVEATAITEAMTPEEYAEYKKLKAADKTKAAESLYKRFQELMSQGKILEATAIVKAMTPEEYAEYKKLKAAVYAEYKKLKKKAAMGC